MIFSNKSKLINGIHDLYLNSHSKAKQSADMRKSKQMQVQMDQMEILEFWTLKE